MPKKDRYGQYHIDGGESAGLFVLKHKDLDVAMVQMDAVTGALERVVAVYLPEEMPPGISEDGRNLRDWWRLRGIPDSRAGFRQVLDRLNMPTGQSLMLASYGLSLTDHYWMQPLGQELYWKDLNFFDNDFSDDLGNLLTDSAEGGAEDKDEMRRQIISGNSLPGKNLETGEVLVGTKGGVGMTEMRLEGEKLYIGKEPQLIVDLKTQENYIRTADRMIAYRTAVELSPDLLAGKRQNVLETALDYHYNKACRIAEAMEIAEAYREKANTTVREFR